MRLKLVDIGGYFIGAAGLINKRGLQPLEGSGQLIQSIRFLRTPLRRCSVDGVRALSLLVCMRPSVNTHMYIHMHGHLLRQYVSDFFLH